MIFRVLNFFLGWDYVSWDTALSCGVSRVYKSHDGIVYYFKCKYQKSVKVIHHPNEVIWLTCHPNKYFEDSTCTK